MIDPSRPSSHAFSLAAIAFDDLAAANPIIQRLRARTRKRMLHYWHTGDLILELNCGTGDDAAFLARHGIHVLATDAAEGMIARTRERLIAEGLETFVTPRMLPFEDLNQLAGMKFNGALSMFGGLNCAADLQPIAAALSTLLTPGSTAILSFLGKYSLWETVWALLRGNMRVAFRRWTRRAIGANVEGIRVPTKYWSVRELHAVFADAFSVERIEAWSVISPPPASLRFQRRFPAATKLLFAIEESLGRCWPLNRWGDHVVLELRKR